MVHPVIWGKKGSWFDRIVLTAPMLAFADELGIGMVHLGLGENP